MLCVRLIAELEVRRSARLTTSTFTQQY